MGFHVLWALFNFGDLACPLFGSGLYWSYPKSCGTGCSKVIPQPSCYCSKLWIMSNPVNPWALVDFGDQITKIYQSPHGTPEENRSRNLSFGGLNLERIYASSYIATRQSSCKV